MNVYEVWATRWDDPHVVARIPARGLSFNLPVSEHGECSFTATVEPGMSDWRAALTPPMSGVLVTRDTVPVWCGWLRQERQVGPRSFAFQAREWGSFFETTPARTGKWTGVNDHVLQRDQLSYAQSISGQNVQIQLGTTLGASTSDLTVNSWDNEAAGEVLKQVSDAEGGPEWYFGAAGTLDEPVRHFVQADRLGNVEAVDVLHYVEDTESWPGYDAPPAVTLLGDLFPAGTVVPGIGRRGGNVIAHARTRDASRAGTVAVAIGDGVESAQLKASAQATTLLGWGWPRMTRWQTYSNVKRTDTLTRHARGDLGAVAGIATGYEVVTLDGDPDWTQVPRGSTMRVLLDTDIYGTDRPHTVEARTLDIRVDVPDDGGKAQIQWGIAEVLTT